ncbi:MAG: Do family serine endopeptidase [Blastocatellia bacterium]|nr:Do family serine endopeptidase [Blastocatellia bacterium]
MDTQIDTGMDHIINVGRHQRRRNWTVLSLVGVGVLLLGAIFGSAATAKGWFTGGGNEAKVPIYVSSDTKVNENVTLNGGFSAITKAVTPAVVTIRISTRQSSRQQAPFFFDPFDFFGPDQPNQEDEGTPRRRVIPRQPQPQNRGPMVQSGVGSGVIVSPDGYILTNNHVVDGAEKVEVEMQDRRLLKATVIGTDAPSDLAVIKIEGSNLPTISIGDSNKVEVGDIVLAIGNPLGIGQTVTMGIISAKGRSTNRSGDLNQQPYEDFLQTDAAINRGNSGGALVNLRGELVGIPSQILAGGAGGNIGIGFAIPTNQARNVMDQLLRGGKVRRGKLGVIVGPVLPEYAEQFGYKGTAGAFVQDVTKGDPADKAGVKPGDIITEFQGQRIQDNSQLRNMASQTAPGTSVKFKVFRDGSERDLVATLAEISPKTAAETPEKTEGATASGLLSGVRVENLNADNLRALRLPEATRGVVIMDVDPESPAASSGLRRGMVIEEVAKQPVANVGEFNGALQKLGEKKSVLLRVRDTSGARFLVVQAQE